ncbi:hypothetical protein [Undibacterium sp. RuRC25W]|uniref:hypothetical protein n=1 Tax=Undibacterium sp. RuRC25W TaxID=3413047 RepID=UPI003BF179EC
MSKMEQLEMQAYKDKIAVDLTALVEKYRAIFTWDIPEVNIHFVDDLIFAEMKKVIQDLSESIQPT